MSKRQKLVGQSVKNTLSSSSSSEDYDWVNLEVRRLSSIYTSPKSINKLRSQLSLSSKENAGKITIEECYEDEPVCFNQAPGGSSPEFFYMYETLFSRLNIKLPFSEFECDVLRTLKVAPTQLHPNSWAYVRAFSILCRNYKINPSARLFFCFFERMFSRKGWVSLIRIPGKSILSLFTSSYKNFKTKYFRVKNSQDFPELIKDASGGYKFPLYWSSNPSPISVTDRSSLTPIERVHASFLETFPTLSSSDIINLGNKPVALRQYLAKMSPMTDADLLAYYTKKNKAKKTNATNGKDQAPENKELTEQSESTIKEIFTKKRKKMSENSAEVSTSNLSRPSTQKSFSKTSEIEQWQSVLQECENKVVGEASSLRDKQFPISDLIDTYLTNNKDVEKVKNLNSEKLCQALETYALQTTFLAQSLEKRWEQHEKDFETLKRSNEELKGQLDKAKKAEKDLDDLRKKFHAQELENIVKDLKFKEMEEEKKNLVTTLETDRDELKVACENLEAEVEELKGEVALKYASGFDKAIMQVRFLYPNSNLEETGPFKVVKDGKLVDQFPNCN
ncbi:uncharacterized protein LOC130724309 [Lotus japonicus]|uniref:uncharacterized protein LOC130724309 n=1 Tax=Lotus japonicus TaxID=34305 RepID=UPI00258CB416|nr:uncharacterized protein LOC130724309 [Lotus japonicus]